MSLLPQVRSMYRQIASTNLRRKYAIWGVKINICSSLYYRYCLQAQICIAVSNFSGSHARAGTPWLKRVNPLWSCTVLLGD